MAGAIKVDTAKVTDRRELRFQNPRELRAELERVVAAERAGTLRRCGNWTTGQVFGHLAAFIEYPYDGYPPELANPPWFVKLIMRFMKRSFLRGPLPAGRRIPGTKDGTTGCEPCSTDAGYARLLRAWDRLEKGPPTRPNVIFGKMTHAEWIQGHLRHAELHLGFLLP